MNEEWRDIIGFEGRYQVSNLGRVRSFVDSHGELRVTPVLRKTSLTHKGYPYVSLTDGAKHYARCVHRLVARAFIPNPQELPCINHKDEDKANNCIDNLEWCTHKYNSNYGTLRERLSKRLRGRELTSEQRDRICSALVRDYKEHPERKRKVSESLKRFYSIPEHRTGLINRHTTAVQCVETGEIFPSVKAAAQAISVIYVNICQCCRYPTRTSGGYHWRYAD